MLKEALLPVEEQPYAVPNNWVWTRIENTIQKMKTINNSWYLNRGLFYYIDVDSIDNEKQCIKKMKERYYLSYDETVRKVSQNDVIISLARPDQKKIALITNKYMYDSIIASTDFYVCTPKNSIINSVYLYNYLRSNYVTQYLIQYTKGIKSPSARNSVFEKMPIPLPPLNEQKRIVEKLERIVDKIDEAKQNNRERLSITEKKRANFLRSAFEGKLTKEWREKNKPQTTAANELIKELKNKKSNMGTKFKEELDPKTLKRLNGINKLPEGWKWVLLNNLAESIVCGTSSKISDDPKGVPVIRVGNIVDGSLVLDKLKYIQKDIPKYDLQSNDLLFSRMHQYELGKKTAIIPENVAGKFLFTSSLVRVRLFYKDILAPYVFYYISSNFGYLIPFLVNEDDKRNMTLQMFASIPIPLPSKEEILIIVKLLDRSEKYAKKTIKVLRDLPDSLESRKKIIFSKAFRGELGTNDPSEENVIELLKESLQEQWK